MAEISYAIHWEHCMMAIEILEFSPQVGQMTCLALFLLEFISLRKLGVTIMVILFLSSLVARWGPDKWRQACTEVQGPAFLEGCRLL